MCAGVWLCIGIHADFGESDPYFHVDRDSVTLQPLLDWLAQLQ
jgi:hypothetical protein